MTLVRFETKLRDSRLQTFRVPYVSAHAECRTFPMVVEVEHLILDRLSRCFVFEASVWHRATLIGPIFQYLRRYSYQLLAAKTATCPSLVAYIRFTFPTKSMPFSPMSSRRPTNGDT